MLPIYPLTSEQIEIQNLAAEFATREISPNRGLYENEPLDNSALLEKISKAGLVNTRIPEEFGGLGLSLLETCLIVEQFAFACAGIACLAQASELAITYLLMASDQEQKRKFLSPLANSGSLAGFAPLNCAQGRSEQLIAHQEGERFILNGDCPLVLNAQLAPWFIVACPLIEKSAQSNPNTDTLGIFVVPSNIKGLSRLKRIGLMGCKAADAWAVNFKDVSLMQIDRINLENANLLKSIAAGDVGNILHSINSAIIASVCLGISNAAFKEAKEYAQARKTFGVPIAQHQIVSFMLADMNTDIAAIRSMIFEIIQGNGMGDQKLAVSAKDFALEAAARLTTDAVQLFGGYGYTKDYPVEKFMRDAKTYQSFYGDQSSAKQELARALFMQNTNHQLT